MKRYRCERIAKSPSPKLVIAGFEVRIDLVMIVGLAKDNTVEVVATS